MEVHIFREDILPTLPNAPGIYKFIGQDNDVLYLGKAKSIRKRVASYFNRNDQHSSRIRLLVRKAEKIEFTVVDTEQDALFLENSLIKKHQPKYNIQLKDGKTYPFLCIKNEPFPRIFFTRKRVDDGSEYLGPYTSLHKVRSLINFIKSIYSIRTCSYNLNQDNIKKGKYKICLEYHIGNCLGPCAGFQTEAEYNATIEEIKSVLKGNVIGQTYLGDRRQYCVSVPGIDTPIWAAPPLDLGSARLPASSRSDVWVSWSDDSVIVLES